MKLWRKREPDPVRQEIADQVARAREALAQAERVLAVAAELLPEAAAPPAELLDLAVTA